MNGDTRDIPDSWNMKVIFYFEVSWLTAKIPLEERKMRNLMSKSITQIFGKKRKAGEITEESFSALIKIAKEKQWSNLGFVKLVREHDFQKFSFEVIQSILFGDYSYIETPYFLIKKPKIRYIRLKIDEKLRNKILNEVKLEFLDNKSRRNFEKMYEICGFAININLGSTTEYEKTKWKYSEYDNPIYSILGRYCKIRFIDYYNRLGIYKNYKDICEGRLEIKEDSIICENWKYTFENEANIYGHPFFDVEFYSSNPLGKFEISVIEEEAGEYYERSEHHE